jgi:hypothetical protein
LNSQAISRKALFAVCLLALAARAQEAEAPAIPPQPPPKVNQCTGRKVPQLEDMTAKTGIHFQHIADPQIKYLIESMSGGVIIFDYDRDGWPDIYFTNAPTVEMALHGEKARGALYHNNRDGTFTDVTDAAGIATPGFAFGGAVADFDNDGWPDLYITCLGGNVLYRNNGDGTFTNVTQKAGVADGRLSLGAAFGDYDNDGFVDLMVTNYVDFHLDRLPGFGGEAHCKNRGIDVACGPLGLLGSGDSLFHNNGGGTFTDVSKKAGVDDPDGLFGMSTVWVDFNNTGRPDIYVANDQGANYLYRNDGNGKFTEIGVLAGAALSPDGSPQASMGVAVGDYLHTGRPSLFVTNFDDEYDNLFRNDGNWTFTEMIYKSGAGSPRTPYVQWGTAFVDLDNDGWLDLIGVSGHVYPQMDELPASGGYREPKWLRMNQGDGTFCDATNQAGAALTEKHVSRGLAVADLFNDGNVDIVVSDLNGGPMVLRNRGVVGRHWVSFELAGTRSNRAAIGAKLRLYAGGMVQTGLVQSGGSYISQNDLRVHFGLGAATKIEKVEVIWPSGKVDVLKNLAADQFYGVLEGEGVVSLEKVRPKPAKH